MTFKLIDRILELEPGKRIQASKALTLGEEYLSDHFPTFPVMPGVLMLECMVESASWLVRVTQAFEHSVIELAEAKNVTFKSFVSPGQVLALTVEAKYIRATESEFIGHGVCAGQEMVKARFKLKHTNLAERKAELATVDHELIQAAKRDYAAIWPQASQAAVTA